ncbi:MAG: hypothetical protein P8181_11855, partial [bacterium]
MKNKSLVLVISLLLVLLPSYLAWANSTGLHDFSPVQKGFVATGERILPYAPDHILVKFTEDSMERSKLNIDLQRGASAGGAETGIASVDALVREVGVFKISRPFVEPKNRDEAARIGVERWYRLDLA